MNVQRKTVQDQGKEVDRYAGSEAVEKFVWDWHQFLLDVQEVFYQTEDTELIKNLNMYVISRFYTKPYEEAQDFYAQFYERLKEAKNLLSLGV